MVHFPLPHFVIASLTCYAVLHWFLAFLILKRQADNNCFHQSNASKRYLSTVLPYFVELNICGLTLTGDLPSGVYLLISKSASVLIATDQNRSSLVMSLLLIRHYSKHIPQVITSNHHKSPKN